jgi:hypothetical protein
MADLLALRKCKKLFKNKEIARCVWPGEFTGEKFNLCSEDKPVHGSLRPLGIFRPPLLHTVLRCHLEKNFYGRLLSHDLPR